jgi:hypothetical protein
MSAKPVPRKLGSIPNTIPANAGLAKETGNAAFIAGTFAPAIFAAHICLTDMRAMALEKGVLGLW